MNGKYASVRDEALHILDYNSWLDDLSGSVESPTGWFGRISIYPEDLDEAQIVLISDTSLRLASHKITWDDLLKSLVGHFLLMEDSAGFFTVMKFDAPDELNHAFSELEAAYLEWAGQDA